MHRDEIVKEHLAPLFRFAWALSGNDSAAVELAQQVLMDDSWSHHADNPRAAQIDLFTTAYRCFTGGEQLPVPPAHDRLALMGQDSLHYAENLTSNSLLKSFRELELPQRAALVLFYTTQCSIHEIATVLHRSKDETVAVIARGKAEWLHILQREGTRASDTQEERNS
jgi:DNA-directed RNA polymerase specialized sigma24 family protein